MLDHQNLLFWSLEVQKYNMLNYSIHHNLENASCDPFNTKWAIPNFLYQYGWENLSEYKRLSCEVSPIESRANFVFEIEVMVLFCVETKNGFLFPLDI